MLYSSAEITNIINLANTTLWKLPIQSEDDTLMTGATVLENEIQWIFLLKKAVEWGQSKNLTTDDFNQVVGYLKHKISLYGFNGAIPFFEEVITTGTGVTNTSVAITSQPASQTKTEGQPVTFSVTATGTGALTYQWQFNSVFIPGATSSSYTIPATVAANAGSYSVLVSDANGTLGSNAATLVVNPLIVTSTVYWGWVNEGTTITLLSQITGLQYSQTITNGQSPIRCDYRANSTPKRLIMAELVSQPAKIRYEAGVLNNGSIGGSNDLFATTTVAGYRVYTSNYPTYNDDNPIDFYTV